MAEAVQEIDWDTVPAGEVWEWKYPNPAAHTHIVCDRDKGWSHFRDVKTGVWSPTPTDMTAILETHGAWQRVSRPVAETHVEGCAGTSCEEGCACGCHPEPALGTTIVDHDVYGFVVLGISDKLGHRPDMWTGIIGLEAAEAERKRIKATFPEKRIWIASVTALPEGAVSEAPKPRHVHRWQRTPGSDYLACLTCGEVGKTNIKTGKVDV